MAIVTLLDGTLVDCASEEHRHECEARAILAMQGLKTRRDFLALVEKKRGEPERLRLEKTMMALWRKRKNDAQNKSAA
ncbi:DUF7696 family protein [Tardiphaga sp. 20_F10_N6_6]|uniref:DUF7696 family protein n=1 Tax=Tardiphaga sp. 20_F10_N6_6 TaxID=3240788 RepID=UPI003F8C27D4